MAEVIFVQENLLEARTLAALREAGADESSARAATRAMLHASESTAMAFDSHHTMRGFSAPDA